MKVVGSILCDDLFLLQDSASVMLEVIMFASWRPQGLIIYNKITKGDNIIILNIQHSITIIRALMNV